MLTRLAKTAALLAFVGCAAPAFAEDDDSRTILGEQGAEWLPGQDDMPYMAADGGIIRVPGPTYVESVAEDDDECAPDADVGDSLYDQAVAIVAREGKVSTSLIQRRLRIDDNKAAGLIERMERRGVVSRANHAGRRDVLIEPCED